MISQRQPASPVEGQGSRILPWILGIAAPALAGTMVWWVPPLWGGTPTYIAGTPAYVIAVATIVFAIVGGALLRSWWALVIVPVAWFLGESAAGLYVVLTTSISTWSWFWISRPIYIAFAVVPLIIGAAVGAFFSRWLARRPSGRPISQTPLGA